MQYKGRNLYSRDSERDGRLLGQGGCSTRTERCYNKATMELFAAKTDPRELKADLDPLFDNEGRALIATGLFQVPRVIRYVEQGVASNGDRCIILQ